MDNNTPSNIFVATRQGSGEIVQIFVHHQNHNGRDVWTASSQGVRGIAQSDFSAGQAASKMARIMSCEGLTEVSLQPAAPPDAPKKEQTPEEEFLELLKDYAKALVRMNRDPNTVLNTHWKLTEFVKALVEENQKLQSRVIELEDASYDNPWNEFR